MQINNHMEKQIQKMNWSNTSGIKYTEKLTLKLSPYQQKKGGGVITK